MATLGKRPQHTAVEWQSLRAEALLSHARKIAAGVDDCAAPELRAGFLSRLARGDNPLGEQYAATHSPEERRSIGATLTPPSIVKAMIAWARKETKLLGSPARVVDPGAGTGRFAITAAGAFPAAQVIAVENDPGMLALLRANLRAAGLGPVGELSNRLGNTPTLGPRPSRPHAGRRPAVQIVRLFPNGPLADRIAVIERDFRSVELEPINGPTLFLGNPPYVRHHRIGAEWKRWYVAACANHGIKASQLAGLHLHFFAKIAELGADGDYGCLITASEWLDVGYGAALRSLLANGLGATDIHILEPAAEAFPGTMTTATITGFRIGRRAPQLRVRTVQRASDLDRLEGGSLVGWEEVAKTAKWSLLVYPERRPSAGTIELGELCRVHRGQVTGKKPSVDRRVTGARFAATLSKACGNAR